MDRYTSRTVEWGHWGITFMDVQPDRSKNFGVIVGQVSFPVGTQGPCDGLHGSMRRRHYTEICRAWVQDGQRPNAMAAA